MRIDAPILERRGSGWRLRAMIHWETVDRPPQEVVFSVEADDVEPPPRPAEAFLVAAWIPAIHAHERRVVVDGVVDPVLAGNLAALAAQFHTWFWYDYDRARHDPMVPEIVADTPIPDPVAPRPTRCGLFFSGGVDSTYTLQRNRSLVPGAGAQSIRDLILVHGFDMGARVDDVWDQELDTFEAVGRALDRFAEASDCALIRVWTNLRALAPTADSWLRDFMGPAMGAVAHALSGRLGDAVFATSHDDATLRPFASHPLTDPLLGGVDLSIHHDGVDRTRLEKVRALAVWGAAMETLRVCFYSTPETLNCGVCPKCIRTKLEFVAVGHGDAFLPAAPISTLDVFHRLKVEYGNDYFMPRLARALHRSGHPGLAAAVAAKIGAYWIARLARGMAILKIADKEILGGALRRRRAMRRRRAEMAAVDAARNGGGSASPLREPAERQRGPAEPL